MPEKTAANVEILVTSRKITNQTQSPSDILFRTHKYKFQLKPDANFFEWAGRKSKFTVEFELLKKHNNTQRKIVFGKVNYKT